MVDSFKQTNRWVRACIINWTDQSEIHKGNYCRGNRGMAEKRHRSRSPRRTIEDRQYYIEYNDNLVIPFLPFSKGGRGRGKAGG